MDRSKLIIDLAGELKFKRFPVSIDEFIHDPYYLGSKFMVGDKCLVYDVWMQRLREIFPDPITTTSFVVSKGGIGTGKSTFSVIILLYDLYKLLCLEYPELVFERAVGTGFSFKFFNVDLPKAKIFVNELWDIIKITPFFIDEFKDPSSTIHRVSITPASRKNHLLSEDVLTLIMSEVNYIQPERRAKELIDVAVARVRSRFRWASGMFSHIIFDTSDEYVNSPMEVWLREDGFAKIAKVYQTSQWEAKPNEFFKEGHFWVYAGDSTIPPAIIDESEINDIKYDHGRIIKVPNELRVEYESDIEKALRDSAGVALFDNSVFFDSESISKTLVLDTEIKDEVYVDFYDASRIIDIPGVKDAVSALPADRHLFCRIDLGVVNDNCGIAFGYVERFYIDKETGSKTAFYNIPIAFAISRKKGQETSIDKIRDFILEVHANTPLYSVSTDQFQSRHLRQLLEFEGLNTKEISVDRTSLPYSHAKALFKGGYVKLPKNDLLKKELSELKRVGLKVDHPKSGCLTADTLVKTNNGDKRIVDLIEGVDKVYCYDIKNKEFVIRDFTSLRKTKEVTTLFEIETENGVIRCTDNHLILTENRGYIRADELTTEDSIVSLVDLPLKPKDESGSISKVQWNRILEKEYKDFIVRLYTNGYSMRQIRSYLGISYGFVNRVLKGMKRSKSEAQLLAMKKFNNTKGLISSSKYEKLVYDFFVQKGLTVIPQFFITGLHHYFDMFIKEWNTIIEVDGVYWHQFTKEQDKNFTEYAIAAGFNVIRITDKQLNDYGRSLLEEIYLEPGRFYYKDNVPLDTKLKYLSMAYKSLAPSRVEIYDRYKGLPTSYKGLKGDHHWKYRHDVNPRDLMDFVGRERKRSVEEIYSRFNLSRNLLNRVVKEFGLSESVDHFVAYYTSSNNFTWKVRLLRLKAIEEGKIVRLDNDLPTETDFYNLELKSWSDCLYFFKKKYGKTRNFVIAYISFVLRRSIGDLYAG